TIMALEAERGGSLFLLVQGGRLRRRLTPALVGSSCGFFVVCVSPSFALACRPSPQQLSARRHRKPQLSELVVWGWLVVQAVRSS
ncbi:hypothetical protein, partial [Rhodanobacter sp. Root179]|uniref:hypothetical protein n=1 Tax=Rhodanobacter sp. Root179 TaxID=1736482 RepID=UPI001F3E8260